MFLFNPGDDTRSGSTQADRELAITEQWGDRISEKDIKKLAKVDPSFSSTFLEFEQQLQTFMRHGELVLGSEESIGLVAHRFLLQRIKSHCFRGVYMREFKRVETTGVLLAHYLNRIFQDFIEELRLALHDYGSDALHYSKKEDNLDKLLLRRIQKITDRIEEGEELNIWPPVWFESKKPKGGPGVQPSPKKDKVPGEDDDDKSTRKKTPFKKRINPEPNADWIIPQGKKFCDFRKANDIKDWPRVKVDNKERMLCLKYHCCGECTDPNCRFVHREASKLDEAMTTSLGEKLIQVKSKLL